MRYAWRLTFAFDGDHFSLKSSRKILKRVPKGQSADAMAARRAGRYIELRGTNKKVLYRRAVTQLLTAQVEYPTGDPARPFGRAAAPTRGSVSLLVPAISDGHSVAIVETGRPKPDLSKKTKARTAADAGPRDLIVVDLPREGDAS